MANEAIKKITECREIFIERKKKRGKRE